jgi:hypothetical protein
MSTEPRDGMSNGCLHEEHYGGHEHAHAATKNPPGPSWSTRVWGSCSSWILARASLASTGVALPHGSQPGRMSAGVLVPFRGIDRDGR